MDRQRGILLVRLKSMGDVLFTLPAVHVLRAQLPDAQINFLVSKEYAPLLEGFKEVDAVLQLDRDVFKGLHPIRILVEAIRLLRQMRRAGLSLAVDFQGYGETALLTWASGATQRWGTVYRPGRRWAYTSAVARNPDIHPAADWLELLKQNGIKIGSVKNQFILPARAAAEAEAFLAANHISSTKPVLFVQPITSAAQKNWPLENYLQVAEHWRGQGWQIVFGGGPGDRTALEPARAAGHISLAGASLLLSAGLAGRSTLILGGDTGLVHLAVAMGKRVIMLMRTLIPGSTYPFQHEDWAIGPKPGCEIGSISVQTVNDHCARAALELRASPRADLPFG